MTALTLLFEREIGRSQASEQRVIARLCRSRGSCCAVRMTTNSLAGHAVFKCAGGNPRKLVKLTPFSDFAPGEGFDPGMVTPHRALTGVLGPKMAQTSQIRYNPIHLLIHLIHCFSYT